MPLSMTPTGTRHAFDVAYCAQLPEGRQYVLLPLPGAPPYECPTPCGGPCPHVSAAVAPPPLPDELRLSLRLSPTLAALVADALAGSEPAGTAADTPCVPAYGSLRYYRN